MHEIYCIADASFTGRATVPVLWDKKENKMVNNESADIVKLFNSRFYQLSNDIELRPDAFIDEIDTLNAHLYTHLNNGVYQAGFAQSQLAYEEAIEKVFETLDTMDDRLADGRHYLFGEQLTESDIRLFVTLIRFDVAYVGAFKTNKKRIQDYPFLQQYMERLFNIPAFKETTNLHHIKQGYYSIKALNPTGIVPVGQELSWVS